MARAVVARTVVFAGCGVVVARQGVSAAGDDARREVTGAIVVGGLCIVVAGFGIGAATEFHFVANAVSIFVVQAIAGTIEVRLLRVGASLVVGGFRVVVAGAVVRAAADLQLVAHSVAVCVVLAFAVAGVELLGKRARTVVHVGFCIEVACRSVCAPRHVFHPAAVSPCAVKVPRQQLLVCADAEREHLGLHGPGDASSCGHLQNQHAHVLVRQAVGRRVEDVVGRARQGVAEQ